MSVEVDADVVVHLGAPPASRDTTRAARGRIGDDAVIEVRDGSEIHIDLRTDALDRATLSQYVTGACLALVLTQRGFLVLHAGACVVGDGAVAFVGPSGAGKSTTIEAMRQAGYRILSDDLVVLRVPDVGSPSVQPGIPRIRLRPDSAAALGWDGGAAGPKTVPKSVRRIDDDLATDAVPLRALYLLSGGDQAAVEPCDDVSALRVLLTNTRGAAGHGGADFAAVLLRRYRRLLDAVEVRRLTRPTSSATAPSVDTAGVVAAVLRAQASAAAEPAH
ncbi:MAG: hypothetical protein ACE367_16365 [Acidimicrobiales bacterium]